MSGGAAPGDFGTDGSDKLGRFQEEPPPADLIAAALPRDVDDTDQVQANPKKVTD